MLSRPMKNSWEQNWKQFTPSLLLRCSLKSVIFPCDFIFLSNCVIILACVMHLVTSVYWQHVLDIRRVFYYRYCVVSWDFCISRAWWIARLRRWVGREVVDRRHFWLHQNHGNTIVFPHKYRHCMISCKLRAMMCLLCYLYEPQSRELARRIALRAIVTPLRARDTDEQSNCTIFIL